MRAAAKLNGIISFIGISTDAKYAYFIAIFLAEQRHGAGLDGFIGGHFLAFYRAATRNHFIHFTLNNSQIFRGNGFWIAKIEA